jgi:hypothetical protein
MWVISAVISDIDRSVYAMIDASGDPSELAPPTTLAPLHSWRHRNDHAVLSKAHRLARKARASGSMISLACSGLSRPNATHLPP